MDMNWIATLPNTKFSGIEDLNFLPIEAGVYFAVYKSAVLYIGHASNIRNRITDCGHTIRHLVDRGKCVRIYWFLTEYRKDVERALLKIHKPVYNIRIPGHPDQNERRDP